MAAGDGFEPSETWRLGFPVMDFPNAILLSLARCGLAMHLPRA
jgi:hypothetical protein